MFEELLWVGLLILWCSCGGFCFWLASEKNRDGQGWAILGFVFGWVALIALAGSPILSEEGKADDERLTNSELKAVRAAMAQLEEN